MVDNDILGEETLQNLLGEMVNTSPGQIEIKKSKDSGPGWNWESQNRMENEYSTPEPRKEETKIRYYQAGQTSPKNL